ncbi:MAG: hypothetical protein RLZZ171_546 [Cyanobacteriota bacterium]|jgi:hypothetical protein
MIIHDLEFFNCCGQENHKSDVAIIGGASAGSYVDTSAGGGVVYATAEVAVQGDYSNAATGTAATIANNPAYTAGYSAGYATGYAVDRYSPPATTKSAGVSIV